MKGIIKIIAFLPILALIAFSLDGYSGEGMSESLSSDTLIVKDKSESPPPPPDQPDGSGTFC